MTRMEQAREAAVLKSQLRACSYHGNLHQLALEYIVKLERDLYTYERTMEEIEKLPADALARDQHHKETNDE